MCVCVCVTAADSEPDIFDHSTKLVVLSQHVEVTALVLVPDLHLVVLTKRHAYHSLHLIVSRGSRLELASPPVVRIENTLFVYAMRFSLSGALDWQIKHKQKHALCWTSRQLNAV